MPSMIEKIARAIHSDRYPELPWSGLSELCQNDYRGHARAGLEAIREPSEAMVLAADKAWEFNFGRLRHACRKEREIPWTWRAMIDAALEGK